MTLNGGKVMKRTLTLYGFILAAVVVIAMPLESSQRETAEEFLARHGVDHTNLPELSQRHKDMSVDEFIAHHERDRQAYAAALEGHQLLDKYKDEMETKEDNSGDEEEQEDKTKQASWFQKIFGSHNYENEWEKTSSFGKDDEQEYNKDLLGQESDSDSDDEEDEQEDNKAFLEQGSDSDSDDEEDDMPGLLIDDSEGDNFNKALLNQYDEEDVDQENDDYEWDFFGMKF